MMQKFVENWFAEETKKRLQLPLATALVLRWVKVIGGCWGFWSGTASASGSKLWSS
jgi:hypothetical protein